MLTSHYFMAEQINNKSFFFVVEPNKNQAWKSALVIMSVLFPEDGWSLDEDEFGVGGILSAATIPPPVKEVLPPIQIESASQEPIKRQSSFLHWLFGRK